MLKFKKHLIVIYIILIYRFDKEIELNKINYYFKYNGRYFYTENNSNKITATNFSKIIIGKRYLFYKLNNYKSNVFIYDTVLDISLINDFIDFKRENNYISLKTNDNKISLFNIRSDEDFNNNNLIIDLNKNKITFLRKDFILLNFNNIYEIKNNKLKLYNSYDMIKISQSKYYILCSINNKVSLINISNKNIKQLKNVNIEQIISFENKIFIEKNSKNYNNFNIFSLEIINDLLEISYYSKSIIFENINLFNYFIINSDFIIYNNNWYNILEKQNFKLDIINKNTKFKLYEFGIEFINKNEKIWFKYKSIIKNFIKNYKICNSKYMSKKYNYLYYYYNNDIIYEFSHYKEKININFNADKEYLFMKNIGFYIFIYTKYNNKYILYIKNNINNNFIKLSFDNLEIFNLYDDFFLSNNYVLIDFKIYKTNLNWEYINNDSKFLFNTNYSWLMDYFYNNIILINKYQNNLNKISALGTQIKELKIRNENMSISHHNILNKYLTENNKLLIIKNNITNLTNIMDQNKIDVEYYKNSKYYFIFFIVILIIAIFIICFFNFNSLKKIFN